MSREGVPPPLRPCHLPRTCGDEPVQAWVDEQTVGICPAPAGMSPKRLSLPLNVCYLPRTCGDEPTEWTIYGDIIESARTCGDEPWV